MEVKLGKIKYCLTAAIVFLFMGCPSRSLFPLFIDNDSVFNPTLIGTWIDVHKEEGLLTFQKSEHNRYRIISRDLGSRDTTVFEGLLGELGKSWFLDSYLAGEMHSEFVIPVHFISRIWINGDTLQYATLNSDYLQKMLDDGQLQTPHVIYDGDILLTASTEQLQELVLRFTDDENAFDKPVALIRLK
jgi:hypothetical protein